MRFMSHKNTDIVAKLENQPYHIVEVSGPVGVPVRDETVTFSGGATATVGLTSPAPSHNIKGQLVLKDVSGTTTATETFAASGGGTGTVSAVTAPTGPMFEPQGGDGRLEIWANQNALRIAGAEVILAKANAKTGGVIKLLGTHFATGVSIPGSDYDFEEVAVEGSLTDVADEASYSHPVDVTGRRVTIRTLRTENTKGIYIGSSGGYCVIDTLIM